MAVNLKVDTSKLNPAFLEQYEKKMRRDLKVLVKNASEYAQTEAKGLAPVKTGTLRESISTILLNDSEFWIGSKVGYAGFICYGTRNIRAVAYIRRALAKMILKFRKQIPA